MPVLHALFDDAAAADAVATELARNCDAHPSYAVQLHAKPTLDGNELPEAATDTGRNTLIAAAAGGAVMAVMGAVIGGLGLVTGMNLGMGAGVGALTGILIGVLSGVMAGTRRPKPVLIELAAQLGQGRRLLTVEVDEGRSSVVEDILESHGGYEIGRC